MKLIINSCICSRHAFWLLKSTKYPLHCVLCYEVRQLNFKGGRGGGRHVKITLLIPTLVTFLCHDLFNITCPYWHGIDLQFSVKNFVPQYTHYVRYVGHKWHHFNVTHIWLKQAMHWITSLLFFCIIFIRNCVLNFSTKHCNYLDCLFDSVDDVRVLLN